MLFPANVLASTEKQKQKLEYLAVYDRTSNWLLTQ